MKYDKVFVIGFGKTATTSFHKLFLDLGLRSQHVKKWDVENYQCFSDGHTMRGYFNDYTQLYEQYPNALFILNTRLLHHWLVSMGKHVCARSKNINGWPLTKEFYLKHIEKRRLHFPDVMNFFKNDPSKLMVISIDHPNWVEMTASQLGFIYKVDIRKNVRPDDKISPEDLKSIHDTINETYTFLNYDTTKKYSLNIDGKLLPLFKNNILPT